MPDRPPPIPNFTLVRPIGRGAYGEVWLARSVTGVHRAVKIVRRDSFNEDRPFEREFTGIQRFEPVSVGQESQVSLLHVGRNDAAGFFYYVMELADDIETGEEIFPERYVPKTLKELRTRQQRLPADECLSISLALARALAHLHENGLVHRDIKPSNVIFVHGVPKLADIGLVSAIDTSHSFVGTEGFVPPEGPGTAAADVFSLGKVIYEISTGKDRNDFPKLPDDLDAIADKRALLELNEVVLKACDADLQRRYATARSMHEDLVLLQAGKSVRRLHVMERRFAFVAKYGVAATILTALAIAGFLWASAQTRRTQENLQRALRAEADALTRLYEANFNWVRANRLTGRPGQRFASLAELAKATARTNSLDLRNEAIACFALPDLRPIKQWAKTPYWDSFNFSASFRLYGTNDEHGNVTVRDSTTDAVQFQLPTQGVPLTAAVTSPDEVHLATTDQAGRAHLWDLPTRTPRSISFPPNAQLLDFTPDGRALVVRHPDGSLHFLKTDDGAEDKSFPGPAKLAWLRFNRTGEFFLAYVGGKAVIYRANDGQRVRTLNTPADIQCAVWHPDGRRVALSWLYKIGLWDAETGRQLAILEGHEGLIIGLAFNDTGEWLASASWDDTTRLWQTEVPRESLRVPGAGNGLRFSTDGRQFAYKSWDNDLVRLYELADTRAAQRFALPAPARHPTHYTVQVVFSEDGWLVAAQDRDGVYLFQPPFSAPLAFLPAVESARVQFQSDGLALFTAGTDGIKRWPVKWSADRTEVRFGPPETLAPTRGKRINTFQLARDGRWLLTKMNSEFVAFDPENPEEIIRCTPQVRTDYQPFMSPDGRLAASASGARQDCLQIWNARTGVLITNMPGVRIHELAFSPDSRWLACGDIAETTFRRTIDWQPHARVPHPSESPGRYRIAFSSDSRLAAVSVSDRETKLVRVETGEELAGLPTDRMLNSLAFSPDGARLVAASESGYFHLWDLRHLREQLASMHLDWPGPSLPPGPVGQTPVRVTVVSKASLPLESAARNGAGQ